MPVSERSTGYPVVHGIAQNIADQCFLGIPSVHRHTVDLLSAHRAFPPVLLVEIRRVRSTEPVYETPGPGSHDRYMHMGGHHRIGKQHTAVPPHGKGNKVLKYDIVLSVPAYQAVTGREYDMIRPFPRLVHSAHSYVHIVRFYDCCHKVREFSSFLQQAGHTIVPDCSGARVP